MKNPELIKILIVDDNSFNIQVIASILKPYGYSLSFARNGKQAIKMATTKNFDLILLDIMMPEMDGYEVCTNLKNNAVSQNTPIIFITAKVDQNSIIKAFELGGVDYITKPFNANELIARVNTHIELRIKTKQLEKKNQYIIDGINYAKRLQAAILPSCNLIQKYFTNFFVIFRPKDIVSGDFYWLKESKEHVFFAVADCTGHGVSGAIMSMLANTLLNEIVLGEKANSPTEILKELHKGLRFALGQAENPEIKINDGIEISIARYNKHKNELIITSSGQNFFVCINNELFDFKGDRFFIGSNFIPIEKMHFKEHKFHATNNFKFFFMSDGIAEQFDESKKKQFGYNRIKTLLCENINIPIQDLRTKIESNFDAWKGEFKQLDDVLFVGIEI